MGMFKGLEQFEEKNYVAVSQEVDFQKEEEVSEGGKIFPISDEKEILENVIVEKVEVAETSNDAKDKYLKIFLAFKDPDTGAIDGGYLPISLFNPWKQNTGFNALYKEIKNNQGSKAADIFAKKVPITAPLRVFDKNFRKGVKEQNETMYNNWLERAGVELMDRGLEYQYRLYTICKANMPEEQAKKLLGTVGYVIGSNKQSAVTKVCTSPGGMKKIFVTLITRFQKLMNTVKEPVPCKFKLVQAQKSKPFPTIPDCLRIVRTSKKNEETGEMEPNKYSFASPFIVPMNSSKSILKSVKYTEYESGLKWDKKNEEWVETGWDKRDAENSEEPTNKKEQKKKAKSRDEEEDEELMDEDELSDFSNADDEEWD